MRELYKDVSPTATIKDVIDWIYNTTRMRGFDIQDYDNQVSQNPRIYNAPSSSSDLVGTEKVGDIAADASFFYIVIDDSGLEWRRVGISSF